VLRSYTSLCSEELKQFKLIKLCFVTMIAVMVTKTELNEFKLFHDFVRPSVTTRYRSKPRLGTCEALRFNSNRK